MGHQRQPGGAWRLPPWARALNAAGALVPAVLVGGELTGAARQGFARGVLSANAPETATGEALAFLQANSEGRTLAFTFDELGDSAYLAPALRPNVNATLGVASIDGYDGGVQITERWAAVFRALIPGFNPQLTLRGQITEPLDPATWARLGVRYVLIDARGTGADLLPGWPQAVGNAEFAVYENPTWHGEAVAAFGTAPVASVDDAGIAPMPPASRSHRRGRGAVVPRSVRPRRPDTGRPARGEPLHVQPFVSLGAGLAVAVSRLWLQNRPTMRWNVTRRRRAKPTLVTSTAVHGVAVHGRRPRDPLHLPTRRPHASIVASIVAALLALAFAVGGPVTRPRRPRPPRSDRERSGPQRGRSAAPS